MEIHVNGRSGLFLSPSISYYQYVLLSLMRGSGDSNRRFSGVGWNIVISENLPVSGGMRNVASVAHATNRVAGSVLADLCSDLVPKITCQVMESRAYLSPLASNTLLVPSRLAFLQRSTSGTGCLRLS